MSDWWIDDEIITRLLDDVSPRTRSEVIASLRRIEADREEI